MNETYSRYETFSGIKQDLPVNGKDRCCSVGVNVVDFLVSRVQCHESRTHNSFYFWRMWDSFAPQTGRQSKRTKLMDLCLKVNGFYSSKSIKLLYFERIFSDF